MTDIKLPAIPKEAYEMVIQQHLLALAVFPEQIKVIEEAAKHNIVMAEVLRRFQQKP